MQPWKTYIYAVVIEAQSQEQADKVAVAYMDCDPELEFDYLIDWNRKEPDETKRASA